MIAGPGVPANTVVEHPVSLLDVFPTLMDLAQIPKPDFLSGHSLLPLLEHQRDGTRPSFVTAQYHSSFGNTESFMVRNGPYKLILFGQEGMPEPYPPLLFHLLHDPYELTNLAPCQPELVQTMTSMLDSVYDHAQVDRDVKADDLARYKRWVWHPGFASGGCTAALSSVYQGFDAADASKVEKWSGVPCK